jgi:acyl carrier protein
VNPLTTNTASRIHALLGAFLPEAEAVARSQDLRELGLTSLQMVNLMLSIEAEFDVLIPASKLLPTNFRSIETIESLLSEIAR